MFRKQLLLFEWPLVLFWYVIGVFKRWFDKLPWNWVRTGKWYLYPPFTLRFWKNPLTAFSNKVGIRAALKGRLVFPHPSLTRLLGSKFASRIAHVLFFAPRWLGVCKCLLWSLVAAGSKAWGWRMKAILPVVGLTIFAFWCGSLIREFAVSQPALVREPMPAAFADPGADLKGWVDVPRPMIVIRPEVVEEPIPIAGPPQPAVTPAPPAPSVPKLSVTQIFARLDRGEITLAETKVMLAAKITVVPLEGDPNA